MLAKRKDRWADSDSDDGGAGAKPKPTKVPKEAKSKKKASKTGADTPAAVAAASTPAVAAKPVYVPVLHGCRSVECYERLNHIDEGTYGVVFRGRDKETGDVYALKQASMRLADQSSPFFDVTVHAGLHCRSSSVPMLASKVFPSQLCERSTF